MVWSHFSTLRILVKSQNSLKSGEFIDKLHWKRLGFQVCVASFPREADFITSEWPSLWIGKWDNPQRDGRLHLKVYLFSPLLKLPGGSWKISLNCTCAGHLTVRLSCECEVWRESERAAYVSRTQAGLWLPAATFTGKRWPCAKSRSAHTAVGRESFPFISQLTHSAGG